MSVIQFKEFAKTLRVVKAEVLSLSKQTPKLTTEEICMTTTLKIMTQILKRVDKDVSAAIEQLKSEQSFSFEGQHSAGKEYKRGQLVTHKGCLWYCNNPTSRVPSTGQFDWTLAVKPMRASK